MSSEKRHIVANIDSVHINNQALCVIEYTGDDIYPSNVFMVSNFDEIEETINVDFTHFPKLNDGESFDDPLDQHLHNVSNMSEFYCGGQEVVPVAIPLDEVVCHLNKKHGTQLCCEDFLNSHYIEYVMDCFHIDFHVEQSLRWRAGTSPIFGKILLEEYFEKRLKEKGF